MEDDIENDDCDYILMVVMMMTNAFMERKTTYGMLDAKIPIPRA